MDILDPNSKIFFRLIKEVVFLFKVIWNYFKLKILRTINIEKILKWKFLWKWQIINDKIIAF